MISLNQQEGDFFNTIVSMVDQLPGTHNPFRYHLKEEKEGEGVPSLLTLCATQIAKNPQAVEMVVDKPTQCRVLNQAASLAAWLKVAETMIPLDWNEGMQASAKEQLKKNNIECTEDEAVDRFLGLLFDRAVYSQSPVNASDAIKKIIKKGNAATPQNIQAVADSTTQKALEVAFKILSSSVVQWGISLYFAYKVWMLGERLLDYIQKDIAPLAVIKVTNNFSAKVINNISKLAILYDYRWHIFIAAWTLSWVPQFAPVMNPLANGARWVIRVPRRLNSLPWKLAKKVFSGTKGGVIVVNQRLHRVVNSRQAAEIGKARKLWIKISKQEIGA